MATKSERASDYSRRDAALKAAQALLSGNPAAIGAVAGTHIGSETCAETIKRVSGMK